MRKGKRTVFSKLENILILESVRQIGEDWKAISRKLPGRTPKQIHDRYINYLKDGLRCDPWTVQEDVMLLMLYKKIGSRWSKMMFYLPGRSGNDIKNRWYKHVSKNESLLKRFNKVYQHINKNSLENNDNIERSRISNVDSNDLVENCKQNMNLAKILIQNDPNDSSAKIFPQYYNLIEPIIQTPDGEQMTLQQHVNLEKQKKSINPNEQKLDNLPKNAENNENVPDVFEISEPNNSSIFDIDHDDIKEIFEPNIARNSKQPFSSNDFILQGILEEINSGNYDLLWT